MNAHLQSRDPGMEHRFGTRVPLDAPAEVFTVLGDVTDVTVTNASLSGAFVCTSARWPEFSRVSLRIKEGSGDWLEALVVRHDRNGVGVEWLDPGTRTFRAALPDGKRQQR